MNLKETLQKASRKLRLLQSKEGIHQKQSNIALLLMFALCVVSFPFLMRCSPSQPKPEGTEVVVQEETEEVAPLPDEVVHEDLGDEPVVKEEHVTLNELEQRVQLGELKVQMAQLDKGESLLTLLSHENIPTADRVQIVDGLELLINLKTLMISVAYYGEEDLCKNGEIHFKDLLSKFISLSDKHIILSVLISTDLDSIKRTLFLTSCPLHD